MQGTASSGKGKEPVQRVQPEERLDVGSVQMDATDHRFAGHKAKALQEAIRMRFGKKDISQDRKWELIEQFHQA